MRWHVEDLRQWRTVDCVVLEKCSWREIDLKKVGRSRLRRTCRLLLRWKNAEQWIGNEFVGGRRRWLYEWVFEDWWWNADPIQLVEQYVVVKRGLKKCRMENWYQRIATLSGHCHNPNAMRQCERYKGRNASFSIQPSYGCWSIDWDCLDDVLCDRAKINSQSRSKLLILHLDLFSRKLSGLPAQCVGQDMR